MMLSKDNLNEALADAVMDRPREFYIGKRRFCLWSPSLGMSIMLDRHIETLGINRKLLSSDSVIEALRISSLKKEEACRVIAIHTFRKFSDLSNAGKIKKRADFFFSNLDLQEVSQILLLILSDVSAESLISLSPIAEERTKQAQISQIKNSKNCLSFGGNTIYGSLIAPAMTNLHMSFQDVVWGVSLVNLKMLMADTINSVYLSDEEAKKYGMATEKPTTIGMTAEDFARLKSEFKD